MSNLNPPPASSASRFSSLVSTFVSRHDSVSTQTPVYAKPMFCVSSSCFSFASFVAMCWVRLCPRLAQHAHVLLCSHSHCGARDRFALSFLHLLRSYTSYRWPVNPLAFVQNTIYTRNLSMYGLFQKPWFTHCFGLNSNPGLRKHNALCKSASSY